MATMQASRQQANNFSEAAQEQEQRSQNGSGTSLGTKIGNATNLRIRTIDNPNGGGKLEVINFTVVTSYIEQGAEVLNYWDCSIWSTHQQYVYVKRNLHKGDRVMVSGTEFQHNFTRADGSSGQSVRIRIANFDLLNHSQAVREQLATQRQGSPAPTQNTNRDPQRTSFQEESVPQVMAQAAANADGNGVQYEDEVPFSVEDGLQTLREQGLSVQPSAEEIDEAVTQSVADLPL